MSPTRRLLLGAALPLGAAMARAARAQGSTQAAAQAATQTPPQAAPTVRTVPIPAPLAALAAQGDHILALTRHGELFQHASPAQGAGELGRWMRVATDLDWRAPIAAAHGRIAARGRQGELVVIESGRLTRSTAALAPHAGLLVLPAGVIGVAIDAKGSAFAARFESDGRERWIETVRGRDPVLPDCRPVQYDPDGRADDADGHVALLAGPDGIRYGHAVLGDNVEATRVLFVERHTLVPMATLEVPAPHVLEDIAPRPVAWPHGRALLTVRAGPQGAQLALIAPSRRRRDALEIVALGEPIGTVNRWMAPLTDGKDILAVHMPHIAGRLHRYRLQGDRLVGEAIADGVSNHALGERDLDTSARLGQGLVVPTLDRLSLAFVSLGAGLGAGRGASLRTADPGGSIATVTPWALGGRPGVLVLLRSGELRWVAAE